MLQNGRGIDSDVRKSHRLYYRFKAGDIVGTRLLPASIRCKGDLSVNWSKYSWPWDVIFDHPRDGIASFLVRDLPAELPKEQPDGVSVEICSFVPFHVPETDNYSHSELGIVRNGRRLKPKDPGEIIKKEFRTYMSDRGLILWYPAHETK